MAQFVMPSLGADMQAGTLIEWCKKPGDKVTRGEIIAIVETDKANVDVEVFTSGVLEKILIQPGESVPVGTVLALIREEGEAADETAATRGVETSASNPLASASISAPVHESTPAMPLQSADEQERLRVSPAARKLAAERHVDLAKIQGTGPGGRITLEDVQKAAEAVNVVSATPEMEKQNRMRQAIAATMSRSKREIPHYYLGTTIIMGRAVEWLREENIRRSVTERLLYGVLLIKAVALALREVPELNGFWQEGQLVKSSAIHVGVAISLRQGGLVAPALHHTDQQNLSELMGNLQDLVKRARAGSLRSSEMADATITVTNLGERGVETVLGVIFPPQVALVGFGKLMERPWAQEGQILSRPVIKATLSADHRATDGHRGSIFLGTLEQLLQEPDKL